MTIFNDENTKPDLDLSHVDMDEEDEIIGANNHQRVRINIFIIYRTEIFMYQSKKVFAYLWEEADGCRKRTVCYFKPL